MEREPSGSSYVDGINLYEAFGDNALINVDPSGRHESDVYRDDIPGNYGRWHYDYFTFYSELRANVAGIRSGVSIELSFTPDGEGKRYWDWLAIVQIVKNVQDGKAVTGTRFQGAAKLWTTGANWRVDGDPQWKPYTYGGDDPKASGYRYGSDVPGVKFSDAAIHDAPSVPQGVPGTSFDNYFEDIVLGKKCKNSVPTPISAVQWNFNLTNDGNGKASSIAVSDPQLMDPAPSTEFLESVQAWKKVMGT